MRRIAIIAITCCASAALGVSAYASSLQPTGTLIGRVRSVGGPAGKNPKIMPVRVSVSKGGIIVAHRVVATGKFRFTLSTGHYRVRVQMRTGKKSCGDFTVTIKPHHTTSVLAVCQIR